MHDKEPGIGPGIDPASFTPSGARPLLLIDADEVLLEFVQPLKAYLADQGLELRLKSFSLSTNLFDRNTGEQVPTGQLSALIDDFFRDCAHAQKAVPGAADALSLLKPHYDIAILTNIPAAFRAVRQVCLAGQGLDYPVIANAGGKGEAVEYFMSRSAQPTVFIDDLPPQHSSVAKHAPASHRVHCVSDPELRPLIPIAPDAHSRHDDWAELGPYLLDHLGRISPT